MLLIAVLVGLNVAFYFAMLLHAGPDGIARFDPGTLLRFGALHTPLVKRGEVWRLCSAMFLHVSPSHLVTNMVTLVCAGILAVPRFGRARVAVVYIAAGVVGSILSTCWRWNGERDGELSHALVAQGFSVRRVVRSWRRPSISAGASAAICGLIAASATRAAISGERDGRDLMWGAALWALCMLLDGTVGASDNAAHIGGLFAGVIIAFVLPGRPERWMYSGDIGAEVIAIVAIALIAAAMAARFDDPAYRPAELIREGDALVSCGLRHEAVTRYERALWLRPRFAMAHLRIAQVRWACRDVGGALHAAMTQPNAIRLSTRRTRWSNGCAVGSMRGELPISRDHDEVDLDLAAASFTELDVTDRIAHAREHGRRLLRCVHLLDDTNRLRASLRGDCDDRVEAAVADGPVIRARYAVIDAP
jgi:membrane associated rhomboid family serine protease